MKNSLLILIIFIGVSSGSWSQQLPEIPMKDGYICYELKGKLNNKKNCIPKTGLFKSNKTGRNPEELVKNSSYDVLNLKKRDLGINVQINEYGSKINCADTLEFFTMNHFYNIKSLNYFDYTIVGRLLGSGKKKINSIGVKCEGKKIFTSFNEYKILVRRFTLDVYFNDESQQFKDLTDYYNELKKKSKLKKKEVKLFTDLNLLMNNFNEVLMNYMNDEIRYLEME